LFLPGFDVFLFLIILRLSIWIWWPTIPLVAARVLRHTKAKNLQAPQERLLKATGGHVPGVVASEGLDRDVEMAMPHSCAMERTLPGTNGLWIFLLGDLDGLEDRSRRPPVVQQCPKKDLPPVARPGAFVASPDYLPEKEIRNDNARLALINYGQVDGPEQPTASTRTTSASFPCRGLSLTRGTSTIPVSLHVIRNDSKERHSLFLDIQVDLILRHIL
jgi:hypothetical protein